MGKIHNGQESLLFYIYFTVVAIQLLSRLQLFLKSWTTGFPRQEYWSGLPFPSPGDLLDPEIKLPSPALADGFFTQAAWKACVCFVQGLFVFRASLVAQTVKRLSTMRETWVQSLGQEDSLEKEMATHLCTPAWKIPWTEEPTQAPPSMGTQRVRHN